MIVGTRPIKMTEINLFKWLTVKLDASGANAILVAFFLAVGGIGVFGSEEIAGIALSVLVIAGVGLAFLKFVKMLFSA